MPFKSRHHLVPATEGGKEAIGLHRICHDFIHATFHENELRDTYNTIEALLREERVQKFVKWVRKKPVDFYTPTKMSNTRWR